MNGPDTLTRFAFRAAPIRGAIVQLDASWQAVRRRHQGFEGTERLLGEACAASALMFSNVKLRGQIALQLQGPGPLRLLLAQCSSAGALRAIVRSGDEPLPTNAGFRELTAGATLAITIERDRRDQRYQGIVPLEGDSLGEALEGYFRQSEQLPTRLWLMADEHRAAGLLLQRLPGEEADPDGWNRASQLAETITAAELLQLPALKVLHRLYHREDVDVFEPQALEFACPCSRQRVEQVLRSLGEDEAQAAAEGRGVVEVHCEFCNERYEFDPVDLAQLFSPLPSVGPSGTEH